MRKIYDKYDQDAIRKRNCPKGVKQEEWDRFVDLESMEQAKTRREKGKASRHELKFPHTTGRRGSARTEELMVIYKILFSYKKLRIFNHVNMIFHCKLQQKENPEITITRTDLFMATHSRSDGSFPTQELSITAERINAIIASDSTSKQKDLNHDPVAQVFHSSSSILYT